MSAKRSGRNGEVGVTGHRGRQTTKATRANRADAEDASLARAFERGEYDTPRIRDLEDKAFRTAARRQARRELARMGEVTLPVRVHRAAASGFVASIPHFDARGTGTTRGRALGALRRLLEETLASDPVALLGVVKGLRRETLTMTFSLGHSS